MPSESVQQILTVFEIGLLLAGAFLVLRLAFAPAQRARWLGVNRLPAWPVAPAEFAALILLVFTGGFLLQSGMRLAVGNSLVRAADRAGLEVFFYGTAAHVGGLLGWMIFPLLRRNWQVVTETAPPSPADAVPRLPWSKVLLYGTATVLMAFPLLLLLNLGWMALLHQLGLPEEPQDLIAIFANTQSPLVIAGLLLVACVVAPVNEELIFRAGLYRFCRQRLGRGCSLMICGLLFGAVHANLAGFLPLALLGAGLALAYEATGDIRVTMVAHGLFNLINTVFVFSSFPQ